MRMVFGNVSQCAEKGVESTEKAAEKGVGSLC